MATKLEDTYVPNILPHFSRDGKVHSNVKVSIECGICSMGLAITQPADKDHETFTMLPCGHVFGHQCISQWFKQTANCPQCRTNMVHDICGHQATLKEMEGGPDFNIRRDLPAALGAGKQLPDRCDDCQSLIDDHSNERIFRYYDSLYPTREGQDPNQSQVYTPPLRINPPPSRLRRVSNAGIALHPSIRTHLLHEVQSETHYPHYQLYHGVPVETHVVQGITGYHSYRYLEVQRAALLQELGRFPQ
ncbi:hypothetical protein F4859DRAFT_522785 [Xylaria cf. heliscus]|nr:hypothetical protein F4859DRAFT_522785 [Xylaria cf. heliscus]